MSLNEKIDICQTACMFAGVNVIESLDEDSAEARLLAKSYEKVVESELSLYRWRFATKLQDLGSPLAAAPEYTRFNTAHQMPPDVMSVDTVLDPEYPVDYERVGDQIHTNDSANDTLILKYRFRADESVWNPYFRLLIIYRLATLLSFSISRKADIAQSMREEADLHWRRAKTEDSQGQTNQKLNVSRLKNTRRGGRVERFWRNR